MALTVRVGGFKHADTLLDTGRIRTFHDFHQRWTLTLSNELNEGILPAGIFVMVEQRVGWPIADVLALELALPAGTAEEDSGGGLAVAMSPPWAQMTRRRGLRRPARTRSPCAIGMAR